MDPFVPWSHEGTLLGVARERAIVERTGELLSISVDQGEILARTSMKGVDSPPNLDGLLPRLGVDAGGMVETDRIPTSPVLVHDDAVVVVRGTEEAVTSVIGLDVENLEQAWSVPATALRPVTVCGTSNGVAIVPASPRPARFVGWDGKQRWLRRLAEGQNKVSSVVCAEDAVVAEVSDKSGDAITVRAFDDLTGDLTERSGPLPEPWVAAPDGRVAYLEGAGVVEHVPE